MFAVLPPTDEQLEMFRRELWKESRPLEVIDGEDGARRLRKSFRGNDEVQAEVHFLELVKRQEPELAPAVLDAADTSIDLQYVEGTRVHTLLTLLKDLERTDPRARAAREQLVERCADSCARVQELLSEDLLRRSRRKPAYYPVQKKLAALCELFDSCLQLGLDLNAVEAEAGAAESYLRSISCPVPFRDAAAKNMVVEIPELWLGRCSADDQRAFVHEAVSGSSPSPLDRARIVHVDFSSCSELTVPEDDPISLLVHESSWLGRLPAREDLCWQSLPADPMRLAVGMLVRMYRLGGRRLGYRLVHRDGYRLRYADESISFYFKALVEAGEDLCPEMAAGFPMLMETARAILDRLAEGIDAERDWFRDHYHPQLDHYYRDVFPY